MTEVFEYNGEDVVPRDVTNVKVLEGVTSIRQNAFKKCTSLNNITIPNTVTRIEAGAFSECHSLKGITIPDSVTNIGHHAFDRCNSLTTIIIPDSVTYIGPAAFVECYNLSDVSLPDNIDLNNNLFCRCENLKSVILRSVPLKTNEERKQIGEWAFYNCKKLTRITISKNVSIIEKNAFKNCESLDTVLLETNEDLSFNCKINSSSFVNCKNLKNVIIINNGKKLLFQQTNNIHLIELDYDEKNYNENKKKENENFVIKYKDPIKQIFYEQVEIEDKTKEYFDAVKLKEKTMPIEVIKNVFSFYDGKKKKPRKKSKSRSKRKKLKSLKKSKKRKSKK